MRSLDYARDDRTECLGWRYLEQGESNMVKTTLKINGMHWGTCKRRLEGFFSMIEGITSANVVVEDCLAHIESDSELDIDYLKEEIEDMGFECLGKA